MTWKRSTLLVALIVQLLTAPGGDAQAQEAEETQAVEVDAALTFEAPRAWRRHAWGVVAPDGSALVLYGVVEATKVEEGLEQLYQRLHLSRATAGHSAPIKALLAGETPPSTPVEVAGGQGLVMEGRVAVGQSPVEVSALLVPGEGGKALLLVGVLWPERAPQGLDAALEAVAASVRRR